MNFYPEINKAFHLASEPVMRGLRERLENMNVEPESSFLVDLFSDGSNVEFGILITGTGNIYKFDYFYSSETLAVGEILNWVEITESWKNSPYKLEIPGAINEIRKNT